MREGGEGERSDRTQAELGRLLAVAGGYRVLASDRRVGWLDHVRYERHADHPDEIVVSSRRLLARRRRVLPSVRWRVEWDDDFGNVDLDRDEAAALEAALQRLDEIERRQMTFLYDPRYQAF